MRAPAGLFLPGLHRRNRFKGHHNSQASQCTQILIRPISAVAQQTKEVADQVSAASRTR